MRDTYLKLWSKIRETHAQYFCDWLKIRKNIRRISKNTYFCYEEGQIENLKKSGLNNAVTTLLSPYMKKSWGGVRGQQHCYWQKASNLSKSPCSAIRARFMALTPISAVARKLPIFDRRLLFRTFLARLKTLLFCNEKKNNTSNYWGFYPCFWQF